MFFFTGKILDDVSVLSEHGIDEKKFIVIMVTKPKASEPATTTPAETTTQPAATPAPVVVPAAAPAPTLAAPQGDASVSTGYVKV